MKREKHTLLRKGDLWIDPETMLPWSGVIYTTFADSSVVAEWSPVHEGLPHGVWETFYPDSTPKSRTGFWNGVLHGIEERFTKDGNPLFHATNENGERSGLATTWEYHGEQQLQLWKRSSTLDGALHGVYEEYWSGHLKLKGSYSRGLKEGLWEEFWPAPPHYLRSKKHYSLGTEEGPYEIYDAYGKVQESGTYVNGVDPVRVSRQEDHNRTVWIVLLGWIVLASLATLLG
jgi:antitoxin component YwqK of YwqJK toxin-antitoxin module